MSIHSPIKHEYNPSLFGNVASDVLNLIDQSTGVIDYQKVTDFLDFDKSELSKIAHVSKNSVRLDDRIPKDLQERLNEIANVINLVAGYFKGDPYKTSLWFNISNPMLGGASPKEMIRLGRYSKLLAFIHRALDQNQKASVREAAK